MDKVSDERLVTLEQYAHMASKPWLCVEVVSALRELRVLRERVAELESYNGIPGTTGKRYQSSLDALRSRHREAVGLLDEIGNKTRAEDDKEGFKWLWFRPSLLERLHAFLAAQEREGHE